MTRIYLCSTKTYAEDHSLFYEEDAPDGGCIVICGFCGFSFNEKDLEVCPNCKKDLIFPNCDW